MRRIASVAGCVRVILERSTDSGKMLTRMTRTRTHDEAEFRGFMLAINRRWLAINFEASNYVRRLVSCVSCIEMRRSGLSGPLFLTSSYHVMINLPETMLFSKTVFFDVHDWTASKWVVGFTLRCLLLKSYLNSQTWGLLPFLNLLSRSCMYSCY